MDIDQLKQILDLVREHELSELEIENGGLRVRVRKDAATSGAALAAAVPHVMVTGAAPVLPPPAVSSPSAPAASTAAVPAEPAESEVELAVMKSPIVGTFYRCPEPGAPPFVELGALVRKGQVLCIIEAMKLMNEIDSEYDGEVVNVYVENGQPVQYGERLFAIRKR